MLGHKRGVCKANPLPTPEQTPEKEFEKEFEALSIDTPTKPRKSRKSSTPLKEETSLESLSPSSVEILSRLVKPDKEGLTADQKTKERVVMPGTPSSSLDSQNSDIIVPAEPSIEPPVETPKRAGRKRPSVRLFTPRRYHRLENVEILDVQHADAVLRALFITSPEEQAVLFKLASKDCVGMEAAASKLSLQCHYFERADPKVEDDSSNVEWLIVGRDDTAVASMIETLNDEDKPKEGNKTSVKSRLLAQCAGASLAGAAAMWVGLAFS